jgi:type IV pilus assembly protein PilM
MSSSTPENNLLGNSSDPQAAAADQRNPLGFADVRATDRSDVALSTDRDRPTTDAVASPGAFTQAFRTEISFRREHAIHAAVRAEGPTGGSADGTQPAVGHAASRTFELDLDLDAEGFPANPETEEKVPFYKREISFGKKREPVATGVADAVPTTESEDAGASEEQVPFYKRELSFKRRKPAAVTEPDASPAVESAVAASAEANVEVPAPRVGFSVPSEPVNAPELSEGDDLDAVATEPIVEDVPLPHAVEAVTIDIPPAVGTHELELTAEDGAPIVADVPVADEVVAAAPDAGPDVRTIVDEAADENKTSTPEAPASTDTARGARKSVRFGRGGAAKPKKARRSGSSGGKGRTTLGLKIGASQIAAAVVRETGGRLELLQLVRRPLESGIVVDGEVKNVAALTEHLRALVTEHDLPRGNVKIGLASNRIGVRTIEIEGIEDATRFDNAVRFKAHEVLPMAFHESVLDYRVVEERPTESGETAKRVLLVVAPRDQVEPYVQACSAVGLRLTGIDLEALGLLRAFVEPHPLGFRVGDDTATVVVSLGHESTTLLVSGGGICDFTRVFDWGGETLQNAIMTELDVEQEAADHILRHLSLTGRGHELETLSDGDRVRANEAIRQRLTPFARELVSSLQFYQTQPDSLGIGEIVITGGTAHLNGLAETLQQMIGVNVRFGDPLGRVVAQTVIGDDLDRQIGSLAVAIGLGIDDAPWRAVNLLPGDVRQQGGQKPSLVTVGAPVAVAVLSVGLLAFTFMGARSDVADQRQQLDAVRAQIAALPEPSRAVIDPALAGEQAARAQALATVLGSRLSWEPVLRDISRVLPAQVWLESLSAQAPEAATPVLNVGTAVPSTPTGLTLRGSTYTHGDVALLLARLQAVPSLESVTLVSSGLASAKEGVAKRVVTFEIVADLNGGAQ